METEKIRCLVVAFVLIRMMERHNNSLFFFFSLHLTVDFLGFALIATAHAAADESIQVSLFFLSTDARVLYHRGIPTSGSRIWAKKHRF